MGLSVAQAGASPYEVKVDRPYYMQGKNIRVSIESSGDNIKGYLIQAETSKRKLGDWNVCSGSRKWEAPALWQ
jgi:hypothetical protein